MLPSAGYAHTTEFEFMHVILDALDLIRNVSRVQTPIGPWVEETKPQIHNRWCRTSSRSMICQEAPTKTSFETTVKAAGNNTGIEVPVDNMAELGTSKRPAVKVDLSGYRYSSTVAVMGGKFMIPLSAEHREASGLEAGVDVVVTLELDQEPRVVAVPDGLAAALREEGLTTAFDALAYSKRKEFARQVREAKAPETKERRIAKIVAQVAELQRG